MSAPTTYRQPVSRLWWTKKRTYFLFVMRELSSVFGMVRGVSHGDGVCHWTWRGLRHRFLDWAASPIVVVVNIVALAFAVLHTVTWFALTPQAMVVRFGGRLVPAVKMVNVAGRTVPAATAVRVGGRVPAGMVIASQYLGLIVVSAFIAWLVLR